MKPLFPITAFLVFLGLFAVPDHAFHRLDGAEPERDPMPGAPHLIPEDALAYIRLDDVNEIRSLFRQGSMGKMFDDPELRPFVQDTYATAAELFEQVGSQLGVDLGQLLSIPQGQVSAVAMPGRLSAEQAEALDADDEENKDESEDAIRERLNRKQRRLSSIAGLFIIDAGDHLDDLETLVDVARQRMTESKYVVRKQEVDSVELEMWLPPRPGRPPVEMFRYQGTLVFGIGHQTAALALDHLLGRSDEPTLAERADFVSLMSRCIGAEDTRPQITFFVDPYQIAKRLFQRSPSAALAWPLVDSLGLERLRGIGGSSFAGDDTIEGIGHLHIAIDAPRDGFLGVVRPESGEVMPPAWVPAEAGSCTSVNWRFDVTYKNFGKIVTRFLGGRPIEDVIDRPIEKQFGIQLQEELIGQLTGRYVLARWLQTPVKINSLVSLHAIEFKDSSAPVDLIAKLRDKKPEWLKPVTRHGQVIYLIRPDRDRKIPEMLRQPTPQITVLGNWLMFSDSDPWMQRVIQTHKDERPRLTEDLDFEMVAGEISEMLNGEEPFLVSFMRGADFLRQPYELIRSEDTRRFVAQRAEDNPVFAKLLALLKRNELPDFEKLEKYFAPSGSYAYDEPAGIHFGSITLLSEELQQ